MGYLGHDHHHGKQLAKQGESNAPRTFAPDLTRVSGLQVLLSRHLEDAVVSDAGSMVILPQHSLEAEQAMAAELVACTLGQRDRPELLPREPFA